DTNTARDFEEKIREKMAPLDYFPIIFTSTVTKQRVFQAMEKAIEVYENKTKRIPTSQLNDKILYDIKNTPPPSSNGRMVHIKYLTQLPSKSPSFALFCNLPKEIPVSYERFIENRMREHFGFDGVAVSLFFRKK
ncbi:MAG: ribosome biogenesis GTPase Der, partial [Cytophagales bacterium]|nr:ribosome biogenesis GTPase Der [Cytophagales bacterium]